MVLPELTGVILAGGQSRRMGGNDKGLIKLAGMYLYQHVLQRLIPQVDHIIINANQNQQHYGQSGYPVIADNYGNYAGPLAGMLTCLEQSCTEWVLFVPCDTPNIPLNLAQRLWQQRNNKDVVYASDGIRAHPTLCLIHTSLIMPLRNYLNADQHKVILFFQQQSAEIVTFSDMPEAFDNLNTPQDHLNWQRK